MAEIRAFEFCRDHTQWMLQIRTSENPRIREKESVDRQIMQSRKAVMLIIDLPSSSLH